MRYPVNWEIVKLSDICDIKIGKTPARKTPGFWKDGIYPWLSISDMNQGRMISNTKEKITEYAAKKTKINLVPQNTLLLSFKLSIGKVGITAIPMFTNEAIAALTNISKKATTEYLYWVLKSINLEEGIDRAAKGKTLNKKKLAEIEIPLPPLPEQKRIAAILDKADALRNKRKKSIAKLDELLRSVFFDMFGDPVTNTMGWEYANLSSIGSVVTGNTPPRKKADYYGNYIEWIKSDNLNTEEYIITKASEYLSEEGVAVARTAPQGSILVTCIAGSPNCIGNLGYADRPVSFNQQINAFTPNDIDRTYFYYSLLKYSKKLIQRASTNGMKGLVSKSSFSSIQVIVPPPSLQDEFIEIFKKINNQRILLKKQLLKNYNLFISLQQHAFRGEL